jgi:hypothetical protein
VNAYRCFAICLIFLLPLQLVAVTQDVWFWAPPKPIGDGSDYEAIGFELSRGHGWSTDFSSEAWRDLYHSFDPMGYEQTLDRRSPVVADTNRPPLFPTWISAVYSVIPRGPYSSAAIRLSLAAAIAIGCSIIAAWGWCLASTSTSAWLRRYAFWIAWFAMIVVFTERNLRNYATDFLTEPFALMGFSAFALLIWYAVHQSSIKFAIWSGIAFGLLIHCRSAFVLWIPFLPACIWLSMVNTVAPIRTKWKLILAFSISLLLVVTPWWIRNVIVLGELQPLGTKGPTTLLGGYCDESLNSGGEWQFEPEKKLREEVYGRFDLGSATSQEWIDVEKTIASEASQRVAEWIRMNVASLPQLVVQRVVTEWNPYTGKSLLFKILALVGVAGLWLHDRRVLLWLTVPLLVNSIVVAGTYSLGGRFLVPTYGCYYLLVSIGFLYIFSEFARVLGARNMRGTSKMDRAASKS